MFDIKVDPEKCRGKKLCLQVCPKSPRIWDFDKERNIAIVKDASWCVGCMQCVTVCPENAIKIEW